MIRLTALPGLPPAQAASTATFDAEHAVAAEASDANAEVDTAPRRHVRRTARQSVAMPFFSFAPRG